MQDIPPAARGGSIRLSTAPTTSRRAPRSGFADVLQASARAAGQAAIDSLEGAAPHLPGGVVLSAALAGVRRSTTGADPLLAAASSPGGASVDRVLDATRDMAELNAAFNVRYLQLQQQVQADTRRFNLVSNVLKTKHDAARNALNNVR